MLICGAILVLMCLIPGFPVLQMLFIAAILIGFGLYQRRSVKKKKEEPAAAEDKVKESADEKRKPENVLNLLQVEQLELEFGYGIVPMVDVSLGGDLLDRIIMIRRQCAIDLGLSCRRSGCAIMSA
jgi:flagellar biosynthesis protein FlhA